MSNSAHTSQVTTSSYHTKIAYKKKKEKENGSAYFKTFSTPCFQQIFPAAYPDFIIYHILKYEGQKLCEIFKQQTRNKAFYDIINEDVIYKFPIHYIVSM